jgi:glycosyltransferase involved in cell wall biosynthesis
MDAGDGLNLKPMRILLITYEFPPVGGGTGKAAFQMAKVLARRGHEVAILTSRFKDLPAEEAVSGVRVLRIPVLRRYLNYAASWEVLSFVASGIFNIGRVRRSFHPELILSYFTIPGSPIAYVYRLFYGIPFVTLLRGQDVPGYPDTPRFFSALSAPVAKFLWRRSLFVTANSQGLADLARRTMPDLDCPVITNAVDAELYCPPSVPPPESPLRVLFVGRLREFKGIRELIEAFGRARASLGAPAELRIAGFGPEREALEALADRLGLREAVRFLGRLDEADVIGEMQSAHVFVNASYGEGMPNAVLEAMACGLPILASDIAPHREMMEAGIEGFLCPPRDAAALAEGLLRLLQDLQLRRAIGGRARRKVMDQFTWDQKAGELLELISDRTLSAKAQRNKATKKPTS